MKKLIFSFMVVFLSMGVLQAQKNVNLLVGLNGTSLEYQQGNNFFEDKLHLGWHAGVNFRFGDRLYFQPGLMFYSTNISVSNSSATIDDIFENRSINILKLPLAVGLDVLRLDWINLRAYAGGTLNTVLSVEKNFFLQKSHFNSFYYNALLGVGVDLGPVTVDVNYEPGLSDMIKDVDKTKGSVVSLSVGIAF